MKRKRHRSRDDTALNGFKSPALEGRKLLNIVIHFHWKGIHSGDWVCSDLVETFFGGGC